MKYIAALLVLLLLIPVASAQVLSVEMNPKTLLPNDVADCKLVISFPQRTYVEGITFYHPPSIEVKPESVSGVGWVQSYELPFTIKAKESGIFVVDVVVNTLNGSIKQAFTVRVIGEMPRIILDRTTFYLNEVNEVGFTISTPLDISDVVVVPLFDANPNVIRVENMRGSFEFLPKKPMPLKFRIDFYNGKNYHEVVRTVAVKYEKSRGVLINATPEYSNALIGDVVKIFVRISNLRHDDVFNVRLKVSGAKSVVIPMLRAGESKNFEFEWSADSAGKKSIEVSISYLDDFNDKYYERTFVNVNVSNETALTFSGVNVERTANGVTVSGDVCNNGRSKVYNVIVYANGKSYYIGTIDPSDFDSFEITLQNATTIHLKAVWTNDVGKTFEIAKDLKAPILKFESEKKGGVLPMLLAIGTLVFVLSIAFLAWRRR